MHRILKERKDNNLILPFVRAILLLIAIIRRLCDLIDMFALVLMMMT